MDNDRSLSRLAQDIEDLLLRSVHVKLIKTRGWLVRRAQLVVFQSAETSVPKEIFSKALGRLGRLCPAPG